MISRVSGPHVLALELYFANLFFLFSEYPENLDPVAFGAGGRGEALKSAAPCFSREQSVLDNCICLSDSKSKTSSGPASAAGQVETDVT